MHLESRKFANLLLVILPTVVFGSISILSLLITEPQYMQNRLLCIDCWHFRAGRRSSPTTAPCQLQCGSLSRCNAHYCA